MKQIGEFIVDEDGIISYRGQKIFSLYGGDTKVIGSAVFRVEGEQVVETRIYNDKIESFVYPLGRLEEATKWKLAIVPK